MLTFYWCSRKVIEVSKGASILVCQQIVPRFSGGNRQIGVRVPKAWSDLEWRGTSLACLPEPHQNLGFSLASGDPNFLRPLLADAHSHREVLLQLRWRLQRPFGPAAMDSLSDEIWDLVIAGTGLQQSLLAL